MYQVNDLIMYGNDGVFMVSDICTPDIPGINTEKLYYVLKPLYRDGKLYTPVDTNVFMRPVISREVAKQIIAEIPSIKADLYYNSNIKMMEEHYKESFQNHDCTDLIQLIKTVYIKKSISVSQGKKPSQIDERYMKRAEDLLYSEFSIALGVSKDNVKAYIEKKAKETEESLSTPYLNEDTIVEDII